MTDKVRRIDFYPDEYIAGVAGVLRADEQGVFWMICSLISSEGGPIDYNPKRIAGLCMIRPADAKKCISKLVDTGKILITNDGKLAQKRSQSEIEKSLNRIQSARESGSKGGRPSKKVQQFQQNVKANGYDDAKANYQLTTTNQQPIEEIDTSVSSKKTTRGSRIPDDWEPDVSFALGEGLSDHDVKVEADKFRDYWLGKAGKDAVKANWNATWRNWIRNSGAKRNVERTKSVEDDWRLSPEWAGVDI